MSEGENHFHSCASYDKRTYQAPCNIILIIAYILLFCADMALPQLQQDQLDILDLLEQNEEMNGDFYASHNTQNNSGLVQDAQLSSPWLSASSFNGFGRNIPAEQESFFTDTDTESLTSCGSAVASPAVFNTTDEDHFTYPLPDDELKKLSVKELNTKLKGQPKDVIRNIKKRRRTLKNRGYAHSCRIKRIQEKSSLQETKDGLENTIAELQVQLAQTKNERDMYKNQYETLMRRILMLNSNARKA